MAKLRAADIMTKSVLRLERSTPLAEAVKALSAIDVGGAPVVDPDGRLLGSFSKGDVADRAVEGALPATVAEVMTTELETCRPDEPVVDCVRRMVFEGLWRLFVVDEKGELCGVLTAGDVLRAISDGLASLEEASPPASVREERALGARTGPGTPTLPPGG